MSAEDKTAAIRREVASRAALAKAPARLSRQVVIYGVPLSDSEVYSMKVLINHGRVALTGLIKDECAAIWEMLERGKK